MGGKSKKKSKGKATVDGGNAKGQASDDAIVENASKAEHPTRNRSPGDVSTQKEAKDNDVFTKSDTWKDNTRSENRRENKNGGFYKPRQSEPNRGNREYEGDRRTDTKRYSLNENDRGRGKPRDNSNNRKKYRPNFHQDSEFLQYEDEFLSHKGHIGEYTKVKEVFSDLFDVPEEYSLAHCVAEDMNMGSGIAVQFRHKFKRVDDLLNQYQSKGGLAILTDKDRYIYYLVTKTYSAGKPTYATLFSSLKCLKKHVVEKRVEKIAMPRIGCGLDRLDWPNVKFMVEFVFRDVDVEILVCNLEPTEEASPQQRHRNCRVTHETYAIETIDTGTVILYFSSEDEHVSDEMRKLDEKFHFLSDFRYAKKIKGNVILYTRNQNYLICGCIVKKTERDPFDFIALQKCLSAIQKENRKSKFYYYAFQAMRDETDACINYKIINILRNSLREVEVYVCWPGDLQTEMAPRDRFVDDKSDEKWKPKEKSFATNWRDGEKSFNESGGSEKTQSSNVWTPQPQGSGSGANDSQLDESFVSSVSMGEDLESNSAWFQNYSTPKLNDSLQNTSFGSLECSGYYSNSWLESEERDSSFVNLEQSRECDDYWSESKSEIESQNFSMECDSNKAENENKTPERQVMSSSSQSNNWGSKDSYQKPSYQQPQMEKLTQAPPRTQDNEYESFQRDLESGSIPDSLKESSDLPKQYSRVCFAREDLIIPSGVAPGEDISPHIGKLLNQKQPSGGLACVKEGSNFLYCLIVSPPNKPVTSRAVFSAIQKLHDHASKNYVKKLSIPVLEPTTDDEILWSEVKSMFQYLLGKRQIEMTATTFKPVNDVFLLTHNKCKLNHSRSAIHQIKKKTIILYLTSADGEFTEEMTSLMRKFVDFAESFRRSRKSSGCLIKHKENEDYVLYGCVARRGNGVDFEELRKCICEVNEKNKEEQLPHLAIQAGKDQDVNFKIMSVLLYCLRNISITMCWPGDLRALMPSK